jgi:hypothetical protein
MNLFFPTTVIDNVFEAPDSIREFALKQEYQTDPNGMYPGKRTEMLNTLLPEVHHTITTAVLSLFYDLQNTKIDLNARSYFQLIDSTYGDGFVHQDETVVSSIIYLNNDLPSGFGTSVYDKATQAVDPSYIKKRVDKWKTETIDNEHSYNREKNNSQYKESIRVENKYNRMISFDGHLSHKGNGIEGNYPPRLTIVHLIDRVYVSESPVQRMHRLAARL